MLPFLPEAEPFWNTSPQSIQLWDAPAGVWSSIDHFQAKCDPPFLQSQFLQVVKMSARVFELDLYLGFATCLLCDLEENSEFF